MKFLRFAPFLFVTLFFIACDDDSHMRLPENQPLSFTGKFTQRAYDGDPSGTATLDISNGYYYTTTNREYGVGSGKLEITDRTINFVDTLFFPIPMMFGSSFVLSGEHQYTFDGENLRVWRGTPQCRIEYRLKVTQ